MPFERMERMETFDLEARVQQAVDLFNSGHNCAQSVFMAYADLFGVDALINTGVAGSLDAQIDIGDIVISTR